MLKFLARPAHWAVVGQGTHFFGEMHAQIGVLRTCRCASEEAEGCTVWQLMLARRQREEQGRRVRWNTPSVSSKGHIGRRETPGLAVTGVLSGAWQGHEPSVQHSCDRS